MISCTNLIKFFNKSFVLRLVKLKNLITILKQKSRIHFKK